MVSENAESRDLLLRECLQLLEAYLHGDYSDPAIGLTAKFDEDVRAILREAREGGFHV